MIPLLSLVLVSVRGNSENYLRIPGKSVLISVWSPDSSLLNRTFINPVLARVSYTHPIAVDEGYWVDRTIPGVNSSFTHVPWDRLVNRMVSEPEYTTDDIGDGKIRTVEKYSIDDMTSTVLVPTARVSYLLGALGDVQTFTLAFHFRVHPSSFLRSQEGPYGVLFAINGAGENNTLNSPWWNDGSPSLLIVHDSFSTALRVVVFNELGDSFSVDITNAEDVEQLPTNRDAPNTKLCSSYHTIGLVYQPIPDEPLMAHLWVTFDGRVPRSSSNPVRINRLRRPGPDQEMLSLIGHSFTNADFARAGSFYLSSLVLFTGTPADSQDEIPAALTRLVNSMPDFIMPAPKSENSAAAAIGSGVGAGVGGALLVALLVFLVLRRRRGQEAYRGESQPCCWRSRLSRRRKTTLTADLLASLTHKLTLDISKLPDYENEGICLASGFFGSVYIIDWEGKPAALKVFDFTGRAAHIASDYAKELSVLSKLDHPNIIKMIGHGVSDKGKGFLLMELAEGMSLFELLYPRMDLVIPAADPDLMARATTGWTSLKNWLIASLQIQPFMHPDFAVFRFGDISDDSTKDAQDRVGQAIFSSRLAPASQDWNRLRSDPQNTALKRPLMIMTVGPFVFHLSLDPAGVHDPQYLYTCINLIVTQAPKLDWFDRVRILTETWRAVNYLHRGMAGKSVIHCDLKPANILLDRRMAVKVADVGLAVAVDLPDQQSFVTQLMNQGPTGGTNGYKDPLSKKSTVAPPKYGEKNDIFSFGVCMLEIFNQFNPYMPLTQAIPQIVIAKIRPIVERCVSAWEQRPNSNELLSVLEDIYGDAVIIRGPPTYQSVDFDEVAPSSSDPGSRGSGGTRGTVMQRFRDIGNVPVAQALSDISSGGDAIATQFKPHIRPDENKWIITATAMPQIWASHVQLVKSTVDELAPDPARAVKYTGTRASTATGANLPAPAGHGTGNNRSTLQPIGGSPSHQVQKPLPGAPQRSPGPHGADPDPGV